MKRPRFTARKATPTDIPALMEITGHDESRETASVPTGKAIPGGSETILIVEDEPPVRWIVTRDRPR